MRADREKDRQGDGEDGRGSNGRGTISKRAILLEREGKGWYNLAKHAAPGVLLCTLFPAARKCANIPFFVTACPIGTCLLDS